MSAIATRSAISAEAAPPARLPATVVDLFCGAGGLTHGLKLENFPIAAGIDVDEACRHAFEYNNEAPFVRRDVGALDPAELDELFWPGLPRVLVGCAPCQPFSGYNAKNDDPKWTLVGRFAELILAVRPDVVSMENVPRLMDFKGGAVFRDFVARLEEAGYHVSHRKAFLPAYGGPQARTRLVLLASRLGPIELEAPTVAPEDYATVEQAIGGLRPLDAGGIDPIDQLHRAAGLSEINLRRIRASQPGGCWTDWDGDLIADCHRNETGRSYGSVYGRMRADRPAPTMTCQFVGFGSGRFGHPVQDRGLSLREGAILQTFPPDYRFVAPGDPYPLKNLARMIGNAVPVLLGRAIGRSIARHLEEHAS